MPARVTTVSHKGRGAQSGELSGRFDDLQRVPDGDWRDMASLVDPDAPPPRTQVMIEHPKTIIARNQSPDVPFDRSINPYRGCEHGCIYCFARPTHAFHNLSPGLDFETKLFVKPNAAQLLRAELSKSAYEVCTIAMGTNTDPYQPIEEHHRITRSVLQTLSEFSHPVSILTKSDRITRDLDILAPMAERGLAVAGLSLTTLDPLLARRLEPRAAAPARRLKAVESLAKAGIPTLVCAAPMIPAINDHELEALVQAAADAGATRAAYIPLRLPHEIAPLFKEWLAVHYPDRAGHVMSLVRSIRDGRDNDPEFGSRMRGTGPYADTLRARFKVAMRRAGLEDRRLPELKTDLFRVPGRPEQLGLF
jgi:DNA repair photolyase